MSNCSFTFTFSKTCGLYRNSTDKTEGTTGRRVNVWLCMCSLCSCSCSFCVGSDLYYKNVLIYEQTSVCVAAASDWRPAKPVSRHMVTANRLFALSFTVSRLSESTDAFEALLKHEYLLPSGPQQTSQTDRPLHTWTHSLVGPAWVDD